MPEYRFFGRITLNGATFYISAPDAETARALAAKGKYDDADFNGAEMVDWDINPKTLEENE